MEEVDVLTTYPNYDTYDIPYFYFCIFIYANYKYNEIILQILQFKN